MTEEIKGMLDKLKESAIWYEESKQLLNYITNLQKENERIGGLYEAYEEANSLWIKKCEDYKSRNEKAIGLIKKALIESDITGNGTLDLSNLLNTLEGGDE